MSDAPPTTPKGAVTVEEPSRARQQLARRMAESRAIVPDWTLQLPIDLEAAAAACADEGDDPDGPAVGDAVLRALGLALRAHPALNGGFRDGRPERYERVNVAVAVTAADGVAFPVLLDADRTSLAEIAARRRELTRRAQAGELTQPEQAGATCTLHDLSLREVQVVTPVLTPPQAIAVGLGGAAPRAVVRDGALEVRLTADLTLAIDARLAPGEEAVAFAETLAALLEAADAL